MQEDVGRRPLKLKYPSRTFAKSARAALDARVAFEIEIACGWRARTLAKEIKFWATTTSSTTANGGAARSPTLMFNLFNLKLVAFHWLALSAQYEMQSAVDDDAVVLKYIPR